MKRVTIQTSESSLKALAKAQTYNLTRLSAGMLVMKGQRKSN